MTEQQSPSGRFDLLNRARKDNLTVTPNFKRVASPHESTTPVTSGRFDLRDRATAGGLKQKWTDQDNNPTQFQREQMAAKKGMPVGDYDDSVELLDRDMVSGGAKPKNPENQIEVSGSPRKKLYKTKTNADTRSFELNSDVPTSVQIGTRTLDLKNYNLLDKADWSRIGKGSRIAYEKKDGKVVEGHTVHALYANKKDPNDEEEYMLMEAYNFKPGKGGMFKWSIKYSDITNLWMHPGQGHIMEKDRDLRNKFETSIDTKRTVRDPVITPVAPGIDNIEFMNLKNKIDSNSTNLTSLLSSYEELQMKNEALEKGMDDIMKFLTRKFSPGTQGNNMQSQVL
jgi:hypothetical protein